MTGHLESRLGEVLERYLSKTNSQVVLRRALRETRASGPLSTRDLPRFVDRVEIAARLFCEPRALAALRGEVLALAGNGCATARPATIDILTESDISQARLEARAMCQALGATPYHTQRVATVVSELARNIVDYTPGGTIELAPDQGRRVIVIRATDRGEGIPHLDDVLAGRYRSRTGLGVGIRGSKRLVDQMDIQTGRAGTRIEATVKL